MTRPAWPIAGSTNYVAETAAVIDDLQDTADDHETRVTVNEYRTVSSRRVFESGMYYDQSVVSPYYQSYDCGAAANVMFLVPFPSDIGSIDRIGIWVTSLHASSVRLGVYDSNAFGFPGNILDDHGEVSCASTGLKAIVIDENYSSSHQSGIIWLAAAFEGTAGVSGSDGYVASGWGTNFQDSGYEYHQLSERVLAHAYGTLPSSADASVRAAVSTHYIPSIFVRKA